MNGGLTQWHLSSLKNLPCKNDLLENRQAFDWINPQEMSDILLSDKKAMLIDVRPLAEYKGEAKEEYLNTYGRFKKAKHIPLENLEIKLTDTDKNTTILIYDSNAETGIKAAHLLSEKGFTNIKVLFNGLYSWLIQSEEYLPSKHQLWEMPELYPSLSAYDLKNYLKNNKHTILLDVRPEEEFKGQAKEAWKNKGALGNAINIPVDSLMSRIEELNKYKKDTIIIYGFSIGKDVPKACKLLKENKFRNVYILWGGIHTIVWAKANIKEFDFPDTLLIK